MTSIFVYRITPPAPFRHPLEGMTGRITGASDTHYELRLTCRAETVRVPRSWLRPVPAGAMTAAQARQAMQRDEAVNVA